MYSEGRTTAAMLDSGDSQSYIIPVVKGSVLKNLIKKVPLAGKSVTERLSKLLMLRGYAFNSSADFETLKEIKEKLCFCSEDLTVDQTLADETVCFEEDYRLPDGNTVTLGKERFQAVEVLFQPHQAGLEHTGLGDLVFQAIRAGDATVRGDLFKNIMLCGGTTFLPGFRDRLMLDMKKSYRRHVNSNP